MKILVIDDDLDLLKVIAFALRQAGYLVITAANGADAIALFERRAGDVRLVLLDSTGLDALRQWHRVLQRRDIGLVLANVNEQPLSLIRRSGFEATLGDDAIVPTVAAALDGAEPR